MNLTNQSKDLINFFSKDSVDIQHPPWEKVDPMFMQLYTDIKKGVQYVSNMKKQPIVDDSEINLVSQIPYPETFSASSFPSKIREHIDSTSNYKISYQAKDFGRSITFNFICEGQTSIDIDEYVEYANRMMVWFYILNDYAAIKCSKHLKVYFYMTSHKKELPKNNMEIIGWDNANTAFTSGCRTASEIVIYRKEEWFKVFLHETFHCFGLDFADMNMDECNKEIKKVFPIKPRIELYETYTETWAEIWNVCFCSFFTIKKWKNTQEYLGLCHILMEAEIKFTAFQCVKVLSFMGLTYQNLIGKTKEDKSLRSTLYKEDTNIFAYYILKLTTLLNYGKFYDWCKINNTSIIQFKKTPKNLEKFCHFVVNKDMIESTATLFETYRLTVIPQMFSKSPKTPKKKKLYDFLTNTMRMTVSELDY